MAPLGRIGRGSTGRGRFERGEALHTQGRLGRGRVPRAPRTLQGLRSVDRFDRTPAHRSFHSKDQRQHLVQSTNLGRPPLEQSTRLWQPSLDLLSHRVHHRPTQAFHLLRSQGRPVVSLLERAPVERWAPSFPSLTRAFPERVFMREPRLERSLQERFALEAVSPLSHRPRFKRSIQAGLALTALGLLTVGCGDEPRPIPLPSDVLDTHDGGPDSGGGPDGLDGSVDGPDVLPDTPDTDVEGTFFCDVTEDCPESNPFNDYGYVCDSSQDPGICIPRCEGDDDCPEDVIDEETGDVIIDNYCDTEHDPVMCAQFFVSDGN